LKGQKEHIEISCPVTRCVDGIGGRWSPVILHNIDKGNNRYGLLLKSIEGINKQMLAKQLRALESNGIISRKVFAEIPPRVEYSITDYGWTFIPVIQSMRSWGEKNRR